MVAAPDCGQPFTSFPNLSLSSASTAAVRSSEFDERLWRWCCFGVGVFAILAQAIHLWACAASPLFYFPYVFVDSDMFTTRLWAQTILDQGWLNPHPHHPYTHWMREVAPMADWEKWWGGPQIFQQSPLYAYVVAAFLAASGDLLFLHLFQGLCAILLFALLGRITFRLTGSRWAGLAAFAVASGYAPFAVYSWMLLRDLFFWVVTAALLTLLHELRSGPSRGRALTLAFLVGLGLGVGLLLREVYALLIPILWGAVLITLRRSERLAGGIAVILGTFLALAPLLIRNTQVHAPLFSSSNRFAEAFIQGNSVEAHPFLFVIPDDTGPILRQTGGRPWPVIKAALATHPSVGSWARLQASKLLSLLDPFESYDNISIAFMERFSPLVRFGWKHWMLITPGLCGALLSLVKRDTRHWLHWMLLPCLVAPLLIALPLSRYRQTLALLWIPWAVYFAAWVLQQMQQRQWKSVASVLAAVVVGWALSLGPLSRCPAAFRDRPNEYELAAQVYDRMHQPENAAEMRQIAKRLTPTF